MSQSRSLRTMISRLVTAVLAALLFSTSLLPASAQTVSYDDVLVVGGTPAGVAAAVAAARRGERVTLVSRRPTLGGVLSDAMMDQWDLNLGLDGASIEGGIFREIYAALGDSFTPDQATRAFANLVASEPRIHTIYSATPVAVNVVPAANGAQGIESVTFETAAGKRIDLSATTVIDATDNADVAAIAGARYDIGRQDTGRDDLMQAVTLMFTLTGVDWDTVVRAYKPKTDGPGGAMDRRAWGYSKFMEAYVPASPDVLVRDLNLGHEDGGSVTVNAIDILGINGLDPADLARARTLAVHEAPHLLAYLREHAAGFKNAEIGRYADAIYVRETRHVIGLELLTADDVWDGDIPPDSIGLSSYPLDLHPLTATEKPAFAPVRHVYGVPFGALVPRGFANLLLASPAISASHIASGSARVIPTTIEEGEAAGAAAALADHADTNLIAFAASHANIAALQADLRDHGTVLAIADRGAVQVARTR